MTVVLPNGHTAGLTIMGKEFHFRKTKLASPWTILHIFLFLTSKALALDGQPQIHDPSTVVQCDGKYYCYGTSLSCLVSDDGWTWTRGASPGQGLGGGGGLAPDVIHLGDRYFFYYATTSRQPKAQVNLLSNKTLDFNSPDYKWEANGVVASSDGIEDCNAIDPGVFRDPTDGRLWLTYGSYFGYIRLVELDPKTGQRLHASDQPVNIAVNCEASDMIYRNGWYYLLADHGSCCDGANSGYNIRMGRSRKVTGPFLDNMGIDMLEGGGKLFADSTSRHIGPGHFGLIDLGGVQKFSCHYEADLDRGGVSVLDIRPLLWQDDWPVAGNNFKDGTYKIESVRTGTALELAVQGVPVGGARRRGGGPRPAGNGNSISPQDVAQVSTNWPADNVGVRLANYMDQAQQKWTFTAVTNAGGYLGSPYFKITVAGTDRALAATAECELVALPAFTGAPEQLWRLDQFTDGTWRIMPKEVPNSKDSLALSAIGSSSATLSRFDPESDKQRWQFQNP